MKDPGGPLYAQSNPTNGPASASLVGAEDLKANSFYQNQDNDVNIEKCNEALGDPSSTRSNSQPQEESTPYSVFSKRQKWAIVCLAGFSGMFSPLGAFVYLPALPTLTKAFHTTTQKINITVTVYMIFQGITPSIWGVMADSYGRRPIYIACLTLFAVVQIGLALTPTSAYAMLVVLRFLSASGSAPMIALGSGTVADIAAPAERGTYMGFVSAGPMLGPCIGPVFGGLINQKWGWRAIFWFLAIMSSTLLIPVILFFPETLRALVGNGSKPAHGLNRTVWSIMADAVRRRRGKGGVEKMNQTQRDRKPGLLDALKCVLERDVAIILFYNGLCTAGAYAVLATLSTVMEDTYGLSASQTGLCYLPFGLGFAVSNLTTGRILDMDFRREKRRMESNETTDTRRDDGNKGLTEEKESAAGEKSPPLNLLNFRLEHARLRLQPIYSPLFWGSTIAYGWAVQTHAPLAVTLVVNFIGGYASMAILQITQVLMVDLYPGKGASVAANSNLFRSLLSAAGTAAVDPMRRSIGMGWTMTIFAFASILSSPLLFLEWKHGQHWRQERARKLKLREENSTRV